MRFDKPFVLCNHSINWNKPVEIFEFHNVYQKQAKYTIIFTSEYYAKKPWTNHERKMAQARAFTESKEYILPARFDDTEIEEITATTACIDLRKYSPKEFCVLICRKVKPGVFDTESNLPNNNQKITFVIKKNIDK